MNKIYIGIDPGQSGGIAILIPNEEPVVHPMFLIETELDVIKIFETVTKFWDNTHIIIEDVHSIFGSSAASNWSLGFGCGQLFALLKLSGIPFTRVQPKTWQKEMWQGVKPIEVLDKNKKNKDGSPKYKVDTKATSKLAALRIFPNVNFKTSNKKNSVDKDGLIDAVLLAEYGRRKNF